MQLSKDKLIDAYTRMKKIRVFEETMRDEFAKGTVPAFIHLYIGQEAIASGICVELNDDDTIASTHRGHGHCLAKNSNLERMTMEIFCRADGLCEGKGGSMHIADLSVGMLGANAIVGANAPIAVGAALRQRVMGENLVSAAFIGDGASNQGAVFEAMNLDLSNRNALVCGSTQGIGKATAVTLAKMGANVTLMARNEEKLQAVLSELDTSQGQSHNYACADFSNVENVKSAAQSITANKNIHILINNTGGPAGGSITDASVDAFESAFQMHVVCNQILAQAVTPGMKTDGFGRVVNIISTSVKTALPE